MITENGLGEIDYGLSVLFDGQHYTILQDGIVKNYPIGGLYCEFARLHPTEIKEVILNCPGVEEAYNTETAAKIILTLHDMLIEKFPPAMAIMTFVEFQNGFLDWATAIRENRVDELLECYGSTEYDQIKEFIFADTKYTDFGCESYLQILLSIYYSFAQSFVQTKYMFMHIIGVKENEPEASEKVLDFCEQLYGDYMNMQHIDFRILYLEGKLETLYTIKSALSLLLFEMAYAQQTNADFDICPNCKEIFVRDGRSDIVYCNYPSPQNSEKTCREIGAQVSRANKEKNDVATREYRKIYMRLQMMSKRHPGDKEKRDNFEQLSDGMIAWRKKLKDGTATTEDFLEWLQTFR